MTPFWNDPACPELPRYLRNAVPREPVSTVIGLTALISSTLGVSAATAGLIGGAVLSVGASFAINAASLALQKQDRQQQLQGGAGVSTQAIDKGVREPNLAPAPDQWLALGTVTSSGRLIFRHSAPPYIWRTFALAEHECGPFVSLFIRGVEVLLIPGATPGTLVPFESPWASGGTAYVEIAYRNGRDDQEMCPILARDFPTLPPTFLQGGVTCVTIKAGYGTNDEHHGQIYGTEDRFNPLFRFQAAKHHDPRNPACAVDDPSTWVNGSTASLNIMRALTHQWPDMRLLDPEDVDWSRMKEAADIDDELRAWVNNEGLTGVERNHTCDGIVLSSADPAQMLQELLTSCDGYIVSRAGIYHIMPGAPKQPVGTLTQDMLSGGFELHTETPDRDLINTVKTEFISAERDYKPQVGPVLRRADHIRRDGRPLETTLPLPYTEGDHAASRPQRLARRKFIDSRGSGGLRKALTATFFLEAKRFRAGDVVQVWFRDFPTVNGIYLITRTQRDSTMTRIQMDLVQWDNRRFDWNPVTDQKPFQIDQAVIDAEAA